MKQIIFLAFLVMVTFISSVELIKTRHSIRYALNDLEAITDEVADLNLENNKLLLEYTHLASGYRIENLAKSKLKMYNPSDSQIIIIR